MALMTARDTATFNTQRSSVRVALSTRVLPRSRRRIAMVWLGSIVLGASILGTIVGHVLSASAPI
jgi:hypothetical protein